MWVCLGADWAGMLILSNSFVHCFVWCVWVCISRPCMLLLALDVPVSVGLCLCASRVVFLFLGAAGLLSFVAAVRCFWFGCRLVFCPGGLGACGLARSLLVSPPPLPPWLSSGVFWSSQCSAGPSLRISGCICNGPVVIPLAWRVVADWLLSSLRFMATKASALCGALPSTPCCGCCSCAPRSGTEVFALG